MSTSPATRKWLFPPPRTKTLQHPQLVPLPIPTMASVHEQAADTAGTRMAAPAPLVAPRSTKSALLPCVLRLKVAFFTTALDRYTFFLFNHLIEFVLTMDDDECSWSFLQGFLIGQLSVIIMICAFIKYFIFSDPSTDAKPQRSASRKSKLKTIHKKKSTVLRNPPPMTTATILSKTYYNVHSHQPESLDWFNVLIAQAIAQFRDDARTDGAILDSLNKVLNGPNKPDFLDRIKITEISLGEDFPIFSNCRITPSPDEPGKLQARMDVDLSDVITLGVETRLLLNYPKPLVAVLPVGLSVSILRFSGTLSISFIPSQENTSNSTTLTFSLLDDYRLDLSVRSLVGARSRLQDVPKIAQLIESRIHAWIDERVVEPKFQQIVLPSLWPRKHTTREHAPDAMTDSDGLDKASSSYREGGGEGSMRAAGNAGFGSHRSNSMRQRRAPLMTTMQHHHDGYPAT
ncbi:hypothetical protein ABW21_db0204232 [Orbilia brochopaga]|nr:hypothetical protein ABW21_db0204232 [Drechslerella brochopaga]